MLELKRMIFSSFRLLVSKGVLSTTIISLVLSFLLVSIFVFSFWNLFPSISWARIILGSWYDSFMNMIWSFLISSLFFFLYPPTCTLVSGLFLDKIVEKVYLQINNKGSISFLNNSYFSGIMAGFKILIFSTFIFIFILLLKIFFISNIYVVLAIQFLATSYIIGKEYYEIVAIKLFPKNELKTFKHNNFLSILSIGIISNLIFLIPILNLIAPIKITVLMTLKIDALKKRLEN